MMSPATNNRVRETAPPGVAPPTIAASPPIASAVVSPSGGADAQGASELASVDLLVLEAVMGRDEPITSSRLARVTRLPHADVHLALETLCELGLLRRLKTVVASYTTLR